MFVIVYSQFDTGGPWIYRLYQRPSPDAEGGQRIGDYFCLDQAQGSAKEGAKTPIDNED
jgi:hypothetical protein